MENDINDLDNIFEEYGENEADENQRQNNNESNENETKEPVVVPVPKRIVRNPRLKFNAERLISKRGIPVLVKHFENVKFKGKGHEKEDLNRFLSSLEHWCHRLYPSMKFEDCLHQIEKLGKKRPVQTCLHKIRLDMPILDVDFVNEAEDVDDHHEMDDTEQETAPPDAFDQLLNDYQDSSVQPPATKSSSTLSEEQRKKMEHNKMLALERRKAKLTAMKTNESTQVMAAGKPSDTSHEGESENALLSREKDFDNLFAAEKAPEKDSHASQVSEELGMDELMDLVDEDENMEDSEKQLVPVEKTSHDLQSSGKLEINEVMNFVNEDETSNEIDNSASLFSKTVEYYEDAMSDTAAIHDKNNFVKVHCGDSLTDSIAIHDGQSSEKVEDYQDSFNDKTTILGQINPEKSDYRDSLSDATTILLEKDNSGEFPL